MHAFDRVLRAFPSVPVESLESIQQKIPDMDMGRIERIVQRAQVGGFIRSTPEGFHVTEVGADYLARRWGRAPTT